MAYGPHLDRNAYFVGQLVIEWNSLGKIECQIEGITFITEGDGRMDGHIRGEAQQEDGCLGKTNSPSMMD
jgi:hypothetical protein